MVSGNLTSGIVFYALRIFSLLLPGIILMITHLHQHLKAAIITQAFCCISRWRSNQTAKTVLHKIFLFLYLVLVLISNRHVGHEQCLFRVIMTVLLFLTKLSGQCFTLKTSVQCICHPFLLIVQWWIVTNQAFSTVLKPTDKMLLLLHRLMCSF